MGDVEDCDALTTLLLITIVNSQVCFQHLKLSLLLAFLLVLAAITIFAFAFDENVLLRWVHPEPKVVDNGENEVNGSDHEQLDEIILSVDHYQSDCAQSLHHRPQRHDPVNVVCGEPVEHLQEDN